MNDNDIKIAVVTGSRAEFGLLRPLIDEILKRGLCLSLLVTGSHLVEELGLTVLEIEKGGYKIAERFDILNNSSLTPMDIAFSQAFLKFSRYFSNEKPRIVILLGDRYEILAVALAATFNGIPIAHISGGDVTEGALDDAFRHCITKLSRIHFTSTEQYRKRVIQLGEDPKYVHNVGALGVENIYKLPVMSKDELTNSISFDFNLPYILCTYHPETLSEDSLFEGINNLLFSLKEANLNILFTKANADAGGSEINKALEDFCNSTKGNVLVDSLGSLKYLNAMRYAKVVVGNSSSAIVESSCFKVPVVNIGNRQKGRIMGDNIINCSSDVDSICKAINLALSESFRENLKDMENPYGGVDVSKKILSCIERYLDKKDNRIKPFYDIEFTLSGEKL